MLEEPIPEAHQSALPNCGKGLRKGNKNTC
jgi:hypothetical protein